MPVNVAQTRQYLKEFDFRNLFIQELGWDRHSQRLEIMVDNETYPLTAIAEKRGMVAFECNVGSRSSLPNYPIRRKIERQVTKTVHEHLIIYTDQDRATQIWQWVRRESGKPTACREHTYHRNQPGDALIQKLQNLAFSLEDEENLLAVVDVVRRARTAFDVDRVTKRFYDRFKAEHATFLKFVQGIPDEEMSLWYVCVTLNRLMFIYFIQKKGFLDNDTNYLRNKLSQSKQRGKDRYYRNFLCPLFFEGFAKKESERSPSTNQLLGQIPYLNGGIFQKHQIELLHGKMIEVPDKAFQKIFDFFDAYHWHLDERPLKADNEINPDVLGYIFEKYINQKQMGAYYTKEDITEYISKNTIIPFLFDEAEKKCKIAFQEGGSVWRLLKSDPDKYIYEAVRRGVIDSKGEVIPESNLPDFVQKGMHDTKERMFDKRYNLGEANLSDEQGNKLTLPTETWREYVERRKRCLDLRQKLANGEIRDINELITYNLNIRQFSQDVIENCEGPELLRAFWRAIVGRIPEKSNEKFERGISILDPTCGSGAFLFAALNILEPLYEACLERMEAFLSDLERSEEKHRSDKFGDFRKVLEQVEQHPNRRYFILKSIIVNNLFGVDIIDEAVEICKLRLFLKLVAQIEQVEKIEPLPDIDFNIRAGNTLVGYTSYHEAQQAGNSKFDFDTAMVRIERKAQEVDRLFMLFQQQQTKLGGEVNQADKQALQNRLKELEDELNRYLASEYGVNAKEKTKFEKWLDSHKPFHWFIEFYGIMKNDGFDVIIGNPPYVEYRTVRNDYKVKGYETESCNDLYAFVMERSLRVLNSYGRCGLIVPISFVSTDGFSSLRSLVWKLCGHNWFSTYAMRPSKLFNGADKHLCIWVSEKKPKLSDTTEIYSTKYHRWSSEERDVLFSQMQYVLVPEQIVYLGSIPKVGSQLERRILIKLIGQKSNLGSQMHPNGKFKLYHTRKLRYFLQFMDRAPKIIEKSGSVRITSELKRACFSEKINRDIGLAAYCSSLFFYYFLGLSDCRNVNKREVDGFPLNLGSMKSDAKKQLTDLCILLMDNLQQNSEMRTMNYRRYGRLSVQVFAPRLSKPIVDKIDRVLAEHYGFTEEELDFIINYDIKYRMGRENQEDE